MCVYVFIYLCLQSSRVICCCLGIFTSHNGLHGNLPNLQQPITRQKPSLAYQVSSSTQLSFVSFLYCSNSNILFIALAWIRTERLNVYFRAMNSSVSLMAFVVIYPLHHIMFKSQHKMEAPQVKWSCLITCFPLFKANLSHFGTHILTDGLCEAFLLSFILHSALHFPNSILSFLLNLQKEQSSHSKSLLPPLLSLGANSSGSKLLHLSG